MEDEIDGNLYREGLKVVRRRHLGNQLARVRHIDLFPEETWTKVKIETSFKVFADEVLVKWNLSQSLKFLWHVVEDTIFLIIFLPLFFLLLIK